MEKKKNYARLKKLAHDSGAALFGVCDIKGERDSFNLEPEVARTLDLAISVAVRISKKILDEIADRPTRLYFHHYKQVNSLLDQISLKVSNFIQSEGFDAIPIPASQILDWQKQTAHLSHKRIAELSGIGWLGRHNIIVNPKYGAQIRLATILTNMPLLVDKKVKMGCGNCKRCIEVCPAAAIKESQKEFDHLACFEKLKFFQKQRYVDQYICGICVKACLPDYLGPHGKACLPDYLGPHGKAGLPDYLGPHGKACLPDYLGPHGKACLPPYSGLHGKAGLPDRAI
jgi:epoxyqueuosine reductase